MASNNCGLGSRQMSKAGAFACNSAAHSGAMSYASAAAHAERWRLFSEAMRAAGVKRIESIDRGAVERYGRSVADQVRKGGLSPAYAQNLVSSVNVVMQLATKGAWESVSPTRDCLIPERCCVRENAPGGYSRDQFGKAVLAMRELGMNRQASIADLAREFGLRSKEASLLNCRAALIEARAHGHVHVTAGTKGGRPRVVPITNQRQVEALECAAASQADGRSLMPPDRNWKTWREGGLRDGRQALQEAQIAGYHDLRSAFACQRYLELVGREAPVFGAVIEDRNADRAAREVIAAELGHGRIDVVSEYLGGRK